jgi:multidrug efflux pump subunit AcrA (membrane-fusion protein)
MPAEVDIVNKDNLLKPGMFVNVELILEDHKDALLLPSQCFDKDETGEYVFMISDDNNVLKRYVRIGIYADNKMEIISGLNETEKVVIVGQELIKVNDKVKVIQ